LVDMLKYKLATRFYSWKYQRRPQFCTIYLAFKKGCFVAALNSTRAQVGRGQHLFFGNLSLESDTKGNFRDRFPISEWMKLLKCSQILRWYCYIFG
jgi:hypothetical protein